MGSQAVLAILDIFKVRPNEARRAGIAFIYLFAAIGAFIVGRVARTVLFLEIPEFKTLLPFAYVGTAVTVSLAVTVYQRVERILRRDRTNQVTLVLLTLVTLAFRFALSTNHPIASWAFYFWVEIYGTFAVIQFWQLAGELFHAREAKRLFAFIGAGGVMANVLIGIAVNWAVQHMGTENLLFLICACFCLALVMVTLLGKEAARELEAARGRKKSNVAVLQQRLLSSQHVRLLAMVVVVTYLVSTIVDYQFQAIVGDSIASKDARSAYLGSFYAWTGVVAGVVQLFFVSRILERGGLLVALSILPASLLLGSIGLGLVPLLPALAMVVFTKGAENSLRYTVNDSTVQLLYLPLPPAMRGRAKTFIDGVLKPIAVGAAGLLLAAAVGSLEKLIPALAGLPKVDSTTLAWGVALLLAGWLTLLVRLRRVYVQSLVQTLEQRRLDFANASFEVKDESTLQTLAAAMKGSRIGDVLHALELLGSVPPRARESVYGEITALLSHSSADVRVAALRLLAATPDKQESIDAIALRLDDAEPMVRAAAVQALTAIQREEASDRVSPLLTDPDVAVRAATVSGLIRHGGLDGVIRSAGELKAMATSEDYRARERAAWILGEVGVATFYQPLVPLLKDPDTRVRRAAIDAAGKLASPQLIPALVEALSAARLAGAAVAALVRVGPRGLEAAVHLLADEKSPREARVQATRVLARFTDDASVAALTAELDSADPGIRNAVVKALLRLEAADTRLLMNVKALRKTMRDEARRYFDLLGAEHDVGAASPLLADALKHRLRTTRERLLGLVALLGRDASVDAAIRNLASAKAAVRGNAIEVLDNLLEKDDKQLVIPVVDDTPVEKKLEIATGEFKLPRLSREARVRALLTSGDTWLVTCAVMAAADLSLSALISDVEAARGSTDQVCREAAMLAVARLNAKRPSMNVAS